MTNTRKEIRLNRFLAQCGLGSRRECDKLITQGKIVLDGNTVATIGQCINPDTIQITYKGKRVTEITKMDYIAYHKPRDTIVTKHDPEKRKTVYDALKKSGFTAEHLNYIGRLDRKSEGLLLMTNDGELIHALTHPRFHIKKVYQVKIERELSARDTNTMISSGVLSEGQRLHLGAVRSIKKIEDPKGYWYEIDLFEGKNRQIRRVFESLQYTVQRLCRVQFSIVKLGTLKRGQWRPLKEMEIKGLKAKGYKPNKVKK